MLLDTPALALRAGDALHIAIARHVGASLATLSAHGVENCELWKKVEHILQFSIGDSNCTVTTTDIVKRAKDSGSIPTAASTLQSSFPKCPVAGVFVSHA